MSNKEKCVALLDDFTDAQLINVSAMLQIMKQTIDDAQTTEIPNAETFEAMKEVDEMIRTGKGEHFTGSTSDFLASILAGEG